MVDDGLTQEYLDESLLLFGCSTCCSILRSEVARVLIADAPEDVTRGYQENQKPRCVCIFK